MRAGDVVLEGGRRIGGPELAVLATLGSTTISVYRKPVVAIFSSGDELVDAQAQALPGQVRDSNRWAIAGALQAMGASVRHLPNVPDDPRVLRRTLEEGLEAADAVVLTGGSSVGGRDFTPDVVADLGEPGVIVHGLKVKPGKPTVLASIKGKPVIGLPGNPTSALLILEAVAAPIVAHLTGGSLAPATVDATARTSYSKRPGWTWYVPVRLERTHDRAHATLLPLVSANVSLLARASGFLELGESVVAVQPGEGITVRRFSAGGAL
ncbi:MAG: molybdopterin molybdotransferase MoeA [Candidatus Eremiobacteraeota bacterium]|nr:molybdopterin molybdotransferase MoeA [Candidatus Eremiobacteraeota bacterium]